MKWIWIYLFAINVVAFFVYGIDKWKAKKNRWRIPESTLLGVAAVGGTIGAVLGMKVFRHKTKHMKFVAGLPVIFVLQLVVVYFVCFR